MFVKKLVEKASKKPGGSSDGLKASDVEPRLVFHYGVPFGCSKFSYDPIQKILAVSTQDGRIKLFGKDNTQALLESNETVPSKFLEIVPNQGILLNVNSKNHIEVWDIEKKLLAHVHVFKGEITAFTVMLHGPYIYAGDSIGNITVFKLDQELYQISQMNYTIPFLASHGNSSEASSNTAVTYILPPPTAESKRVLIIYRYGVIKLWDIRESKSTFATGGSREGKQATCACWVCPFGSRVAVGYSNGEILIWSIATSKGESALESDTQNAPPSKLNLGFKSENVPIASMRWTYADAKASRLYVMGASDSASSNMLQVILLNEHTESRNIKLGLSLSEPCLDMEIISSSNEQNKHKQGFLLLIGKSGHVYIFDDSSIEKYLLQSQSRSPPSLPREVTAKMPFLDSSITITKLVTGNHYMLRGDDDYVLLTKDIPSPFPLEMKSKDGSHLTSNSFNGFSEIKNLYITGHKDGSINFWDLSCPFPIPVLSLKQQSEDDFSVSGIPVTALHFDGSSRILVSGDQNGTVRIFKFKPEPYSNSFISFQGSTKKGNNNFLQSLKLLKVNGGAILSFNIDQGSKHLAIGSDQGYVSVIDIEGLNLLYEKHFPSEISTGIIAMQFMTCNIQNFEKNVLMVATKDSSVLALDSDTGNTLSASPLRPNKPSKALYMHILDGQDTTVRGSNTSNGVGSPVEDAIPKQSVLLLCSEKAAYIYSFSHAVQGVRKVLYKKKFQSTSCCYASIFHSGSDTGLMLVFTDGKVEIRSLPELSLLKEASVRGFRYSAPKLNSLSESSICSSGEGDLLMVNGDQEIFIASVLLQKESFRLLDSVGQVYQKDLAHDSGPLVQKEKKKGIFGSVLKGGKTKPTPETEDTKESIQELSVIFSTANFRNEDETVDNSLAVKDDESELNIDDISIDDVKEKPKEQNMFNTQKFANKFQAFTGKLKQQMKAKNEKTAVIKEEQPEEKAGTGTGTSVDLIKKRYGFSSTGETSAAKMAENKLHENLKKLQGISLKTTDMTDTAKSFASMAKDLLRNTEQDKRNS